MSPPCRSISTLSQSIFGGLATCNSQRYHHDAIWRIVPSSYYLRIFDQVIMFQNNNPLPRKKYAVMVVLRLTGLPYCSQWVWDRLATIQWPNHVTAKQFQHMILQKRVFLGQTQVQQRKFAIPKVKSFQRSVPRHFSHHCRSAENKGRLRTHPCFTPGVFYIHVHALINFWLRSAGGHISGEEHEYRRTCRVEPLIWISWAWDVLFYKRCGGGVLKQRLVQYTMDVNIIVPWIRLQRWLSDPCKLCFANDIVPIARRGSPTFGWTRGISWSPSPIFISMWDKEGRGGHRHHFK